MNVIDRTAAQVPMGTIMTPVKYGAAQDYVQTDSVEISRGDSVGMKILNFPGNAVKETAGIASGLLKATCSIIPSAFGGIQAGLTVIRPEAAEQNPGFQGKAEGGYGAMYIIEAGAAGVTAGGLIAGPWGALAGGGAGLVLGAVKLGIDYSTGAAKRVTGQIEKETYEPVADNLPTGDWMYDAGKDLTEGAIVGMKAGVKESFAVGQEKGRATAIGFWEGTKGAVRTLAYHATIQPEPPPAEQRTPGDRIKEAALFVARIPKETMKIAVGTATGLAGAALTAPNGLVEGVIQGATHRGTIDNISMSVKGHHVMMRGESLLLGAAAGALMGPAVTVGWTLAGALGGYITGVVTTAVEKKTGTDRQIVQNMENHLKREVSDNADLGSSVANGHRNVIEGAMVGTAAAAKEGFNAGYDMGAGIVQGVADSIVGIGKGLKGAFDAIWKPVSQEA